MFAFNVPLVGSISPLLVLLLEEKVKNNQTNHSPQNLTNKTKPSNQKQQQKKSNQNKNTTEKAPNPSSLLLMNSIATCITG